MTQNAEIHLENARLQTEVSEYIGLPSSSVLFEYSEVDNKVKLDIITVNAIHRQSFLFHSVIGIDKIDSLNKMLDYVRDYKDKDSSYTIQWSLKGDNELNTSYFRSSNILSALDKLFYGRDQSSIVVFSVVLNPIS